MEDLTLHLWALDEEEKIELKDVLKKIEEDFSLEDLPELPIIHEEKYD